MNFTIFTMPTENTMKDYNLSKTKAKAAEWHMSRTDLALNLKTYNKGQNKD